MFIVKRLILHLYEYNILRGVDNASTRLRKQWGPSPIFLFICVDVISMCDHFIQFNMRHIFM